MKIEKNYDLKDITTFHLPVKCSYFATYETEEELQELLTSELCRNNRIMHIGEGSNLVFTGDFDGVILKSEINHFHIIDHGNDRISLCVGSGIEWDHFVKTCVASGFYGAENMSYIPGTVGASAVQNIGSYGVEVKDIISGVRAVNVQDGSVRYFTNKECEYGYRDSIFKNSLKDKYIVTSVNYELTSKKHFNLEYGPLKRLAESSDLTLQKVRDEIIAIRCSKLPDPKHVGNAGSFFKNPIVDAVFFEKFISNNPDAPHYLLEDGKVKIPAGWLIEHCGLKGYRCGGAAVWEKQCLVIANVDNAFPKDVVDLCNHIVETVKSRYGIELSPEANII